MEKRILKVLKALADYHDLTLGDLLEGIVLHAFEGKAPFRAESTELIRELKRIYGLKLDASASHRLIESGSRTRLEGAKGRRATPGPKGSARGTAAQKRVRR